VLAGHLPSLSARGALWSGVNALGTTRFLFVEPPLVFLANARRLIRVIERFFLADECRLAFFGTPSADDLHNRLAI
jgi:hypothetical protein